MFASIFNRTLFGLCESFSNFVLAGSTWCDLKVDTFPLLLRGTSFPIVWYRTIFEFSEVYNITFTFSHAILRSRERVGKFFHRNASLYTKIRITFFPRPYFRVSSIPRRFYSQMLSPLRRCFIRTNNQYLRSRPICILRVNIQLGQFIQANVITTCGYGLKPARSSGREGRDFIKL